MRATLELNTAISPRDLRIKAVHSAIREFNHNDPSKHDQELDLHADKILLQKLSFCYGIRKCDEELGLLCGAMELIYRASRSRVGISFHEVGESLLPLFVDMLRWSGARRNDILLAKSLAEQKEAEEKIKYDLNDGNAIAQHRTNTDFGRSNMMISAKSAKLKGSLSTVTEEKKEKGDEYEGEEEEETLMIQEEETFTASCSSNDAETEADMSSEVDSTAATAAIVPPKRQVRFSESVEVTSNGENMHETAIKIRNNDVTNPVAVKKVIKILRYFSRVLTAMIPMAHFPGLLDELIFFLRVPKGTGSVAEVLEEGSGVFSSDNSFHSARTNNSMESVYSDANSFYSSDEAAYASRQNSDATQSSRLDAIATIVNLACAEENKPKLLNHPGLLEAVICVARDDPVNEAREHASIVLMNLALVDSNKVTLSRICYFSFVVVVCFAFLIPNLFFSMILIIKISMANSDELLNTILTLLSDEVVNVRRYASAVMLSLACVSQNTRRIVGFDEGRPLSELSLVLTNDEVEEIRVNVAECLFNCVRYSAEAETIELMGQHKHVLPALSATVLSDYSADVRAYSAR